MAAVCFWKNFCRRLFVCGSYDTEEFPAAAFYFWDLYGLPVFDLLVRIGSLQFLENFWDNFSIVLSLFHIGSRLFVTLVIGVSEGYEEIFMLSPWFVFRRHTTSLLLPQLFVITDIGHMASQPIIRTASCRKSSLQACCLWLRDGNNTSFPLIHVTPNWEKWFPSQQSKSCGAAESR